MATLQALTTSLYSSSPHHVIVLEQLCQQASVSCVAEAGPKVSEQRLLQHARVRQDRCARLRGAAGLGKERWRKAAPATTGSP